MNAPTTLIDPRGVLWHRAEPTRNGDALYVVDGVDPTTVRPWVMSTETELAALFGAPMQNADEAAQKGAAA